MLQDNRDRLPRRSAPYEITVNPIPSETLAAIAAFCEGSTTASLPTSQNGYAVTWYESDKTTLAERDLSKLAGSTTDYTYYYTLTDESQPTNCTSDPEAYTFTVKPTAKVTLAVTYECDKTTITPTTVPATATLAWTTPTGTSAANPLVLDGITNGAGTYSVVASATGYCDSEPASEAVKFYITPGSIKPVSPEYLKVDGAPNYQIIDASAASLKEADAEITVYWSAPQGDINGRVIHTDGTGFRLWRNRTDRILI